MFTAATSSPASTKTLKIKLVDPFKAEEYLSIHITLNEELSDSITYSELQNLIFAKLGEFYGIDFTPEQIPELKYHVSGKIVDTAISIKENDKVPLNLFLADPEILLTIKTLLDQDEMQKILKKISDLNETHRKVKIHADILQNMMAISEFIHAAIDHSPNFDAWLEIDKGKQFFTAFTALNANFNNLLCFYHAMNEYQKIIKQLPRNEDKLPWLTQNPSSIPYAECEQLAKIADFMDCYPRIGNFLKQELLPEKSLLNIMSTSFTAYKDKLKSDEDNIQKQLKCGREVEYDATIKQKKLLAQLKRYGVLFVDEIKKIPTITPPLPTTTIMTLLKQSILNNSKSAKDAVDQKIRFINNKTATTSISKDTPDTPPGNPQRKL